MSRADYAIRPFEPCDQSAARQLILAGLGEHFGYLDESLNPDLDDIMADYITQGRVFVVVMTDEELVGTGALKIKHGQVGQLVRMSVRREHRRRGIGQV